jgi:hypothetical protein
LRQSIYSISSHEDHTNLTTAIFGPELNIRSWGERIRRSGHWC